jgi:hypothetical protein
MADDPNAPRVLLSVASDIEAASIVTALDARDIGATATGGFTSSFRAEAPGTIKVIVRRADLDRAQRALAEIREEQGQIDWSKIDVGQDDDMDAPPTGN